MNRILLAAALLLLAVGLTAPATARMESGLGIRFVPLEADRPVAAVADQTYRGRLEILGDAHLDISEFTIAGPGWNRLTWTPVVGSSLDPSYPLRVEFSGTPSAAGDPLTITIRAGGKALRRTLILGGEQFQKTIARQPLKQADFPVPQPWISPHAVSTPAAPVISEGANPSSAQGYDIRIRGRFIYLRDGTTVMGADGMTVEVYDDDPVFDDHLGTGMTDPLGNFDFTVNWDDILGEELPDLRVEFHSENSRVLVKTWWMVVPYIFESGLYNNFAGEDLDMGIVIPENEDMHGVLHVMTLNTRCWRYVHGTGYETRQVEVRWPSGEDGASYNRYFETIEIPPNRTWNSGTQAHEFGHHIMNCLSELPEIDYCNDMCDENPPFECGHCRWCEEDEPIAWSEGWANYMGHVIPHTFDAMYGTPPNLPRNMAAVDTCGETGLVATPLITEGFTSTVLVDMDDDSEDEDINFPGFKDRVALGGDVLMEILAEENSMTTMAYLREVLAYFPGQGTDIWFTAMNNGFDLDEDPPDMVFPIVCTSGQSPNVPSPNNTLSFYWQTPDDDVSGVRGFHMWLFEDEPGNPVGGDVVEGANTFAYSDVEPGTYYFTIRTIDWAGNFSVDYTTSGPYIITEPDPRNLAFMVPTSWDYYVVPRNTDDATYESCPMPTTLYGDQLTYWNLAGRNEGDIATGEDLITALELDGVELDRFNWGNLPGGSPFVIINQGPELIMGGLHTFAGRLDPEGVITETSETDNARGKQFAWRPGTVTPNILYQNPFPIPDPTGGWDAVSDMFLFSNSYGITFNSSSWWNALVAWSDNPDTDYDLRLHEVNENAMGGFLLLAEASTQPAGWIDAVVVNRNLMGATPWDAGVVNPRLDTGTLKFRQVTSTEVSFPDTVTEVMGSNDYLLLREFEIGYWEEGGVSIDLWTDPPQQNVSLAWCDADFATGDLLDADAMALTGADGHAQVNVVVPEMGYTCLMISRRPAAGDDDLQVTYRIRPTLPDLEPAHLTGWHSPVVPRPNTYATEELVELPTVLEGDLEQTWFSFAAANISTGTAWGAMRFYVYVDQGLGSLNYFHVFDIDPNDTAAIVNEGPSTIRGGRHTLVLNLDALDYMEELNENNNTYGEQYVWAPSWSDFNTPVTRHKPPDRVAGWPYIATDEPIYYNCDGLRPWFMSFAWQVVSVMPGPNSDVDLRLHELTGGVKNGFGASVARSSWGPGQSDYIVINYFEAGGMPYDIGVLAISGDEEYTIETPLEIYTPGGKRDFGPVELAAGQIMNVFDVMMEPGDWKVSLGSTGGNLDVGLTIHPNDVPFLSKADVLEGGSSWFGGPGEGEEITVTIEEAGFYPITVWKVGAEDLDQAGSFTLAIAADDPSPAQEEELPRVTRMAGVYPNPFNPQTTVKFELAEPAQVNLAVYDLAGRKVVTLLHEAVPAGRHQQVWKGQDAAGRQVASGMYVVRLDTGKTTDLKKVMLLK